MTCLPLFDILRLCVIFFTGFILLTIVGYQSLLPILQDEGIFSSLCSSSTINNNSCNAQTLRLDMMFNISITTLNAATLFWGILCLKCGPRSGVVIGGALMTISPFIFSFGYDWPCFFSYITMSIGAGGVLFGLFAIPTQYPKIQGFLFSLLTGFLDASSGIFYIFLMLYKHAGISMRFLFIILSVISAICSLLVYFFVYSSRFDTKPDQDKNEPKKESKEENIDELLNIQSDNNQINGKDDNDHEPLINKSTQDSMLSILARKELLYLTIWSMFYMLTKYFYITTLNKQIGWITNNDDDKIYVSQQVFSIMLLLSGFYSFVTGPIIDKYGMKIALIVMAFVSLIGCILSVIKVYNLQWITMCCFVFNRFFYFALAPLLIAVIFGIDKQLMVYGVVLFISSMFNLLGYLLDDLVTYQLNGDYTIVNLVTGISCFVVALVLCYKLRTHENIT